MTFRAKRCGSRRTKEVPEKPPRHRRGYIGMGILLEDGYASLGAKIVPVEALDGNFNGRRSGPPRRVRAWPYANKKRNFKERPSVKTQSQARLSTQGENKISKVDDESRNEGQEKGRALRSRGLSPSAAAGNCEDIGSKKPRSLRHREKRFHQRIKKRPSKTDPDDPANLLIAKKKGGLATWRAALMLPQGLHGRGFAWLG